MPSMDSWCLLNLGLAASPKVSNFLDISHEVLTCLPRIHDVTSGLDVSLKVSNCLDESPEVLICLPRIHGVS